MAQYTCTSPTPLLVGCGRAQTPCTHARVTPKPNHRLRPMCGPSATARKEQAGRWRTSWCNGRCPRRPRRTSTSGPGELQALCWKQSWRWWSRRPGSRALRSHGARTSSAGPRRRRARPRSARWGSTSGRPSGRRSNGGRQPRRKLKVSLYTEPAPPSRAPPPDPGPPRPQLHEPGLRSPCVEPGLCAGWAVVRRPPARYPDSLERMPVPPRGTHRVPAPFVARPR